VQTGLRLSELTALTREDVHVGGSAHVHVMGKGRKERAVPLTRQTVAVLQSWLAEPPVGEGWILFPNRRGTRLSNDGLQYLLARHVVNACQTCPSLCGKRVSPHVLRHTAAMELLQPDFDTITYIFEIRESEIQRLNAQIAPNAPRFCKCRFKKGKSIN
jgi:integrase/recombinase XerD